MSTRACNSASGPQAAMGDLQKATRPSHHVDGGKFDNPWPTWQGDKSFGEVTKWFFRSGKTRPSLVQVDNPTPEDYRRVSEGSFRGQCWEVASATSPPGPIGDNTTSRRPSGGREASGYQGELCSRTEPFPSWGSHPAVLQQRGCSPHPDGTFKGPRRAFPLNPVDHAALAAPPPDGIQVLWVGHSTVVVQMEGATFLTDPIFSERASPFSFTGPKRFVPAALHASSPCLPALDFVLISHNHYDHLDKASVKALHACSGSHLTWYVPLGLSRWFASVGVTNVIEMDWWQEIQHAGSKVVVCMVPAQHYSWRHVSDKRTTLWGGYVVKGPSRRFYFAGDTGYCSAFSEIGAKYGPIDVAAIPIGAYEPRWFMSSQHVNPEEALTIHQEVRARRSLAIHCCTFHLTDEPLDLPPKRMVELLREQGQDPDAFITMQHGEMLRIGADGQLTNTPLRLGV